MGEEVKESQKRNCWEQKRCERQPGGVNADEFGICPASTTEELDGVHGGKNAGRACWVVAGTLCDGEPVGTFAKKQRVCSFCDFYTLVREEEGDESFIPTFVLLNMLEQ